MDTPIQKGGISVDTAHIFPIIKQWLYSEKEIFLREIVSNACDAVTKLTRLSSLGHAEDHGDHRILVTVDREEKTLTVSDDGIGMSEEELKTYICQIALSGAMDFIEKYEGEDGGKNGIIGHFGLGFYSSFMVADRVEIITRSYQNTPAVHWVCTENGEYEIHPGAERAQNGTDVVMHITEDCEEYLTEAKIRAVLDKYCAFLPVPVYLTVIPTEEEAKAEEEKNKEKTDVTPEEPKPINDTNPLWQRAPSECTDEDYLAFYRKVFGDYREPLFWIHVNADYPLNFKGILYFPRIGSEYESLEGQVKLYYNQVFVADNIKEVIPEYLLMLKGVLDCPELPLNVSRSYLQNSGYVSKISAHIVKKVADKLNALMNNDRAKYEGLWSDIRTFVEYACMRDHKFFDRVKPALLLPLAKGGCKTVDEAIEDAKTAQENTLYYTTDPVAQAQYISLFESQSITVYLLDKMLDAQFINLLEGDKSVKFYRVDAALPDSLKGEGSVTENEALTALFREQSGISELAVKYEALKDASLPAMLSLDEQNRRFEDMMKMYSMDTGHTVPQKMTLVINTASPLIEKLAAKPDSEAAKKAARQIYTLALLSQRQLSAEELRAFLAGSYGILEDTLTL